MRKLTVIALSCLVASALFAAGQTPAKAKTAKTAKAAKSTIDFIVVESDEYASGKYDPSATATLANFLQGEANVKVMGQEEALQDETLAQVDYGFLPVYLAKKTPELRAKLEQQLAAGYVQENENYLIFPHMSRTGVYSGKQANPGVLEIFVMSQCPYGAMAENLVINAQKAGKIPAGVTIKLRYIVSYDEQTGEFSSLHGSGEWEEDVRQLLIAKYYPTKLWKYLEIRNKDYRSSRWDKAMKEAGINPTKIMKKFDTEGIALLKAEAAYGTEYGINASPTFLWEGKELLDFGSVSEKEGLEFLNPNLNRPSSAAAAPSGSC